MRMKDSNPLIDLEKLGRARNLRNELAEIQSMLEPLLRPTLTDTARIGEVFDIYREVLARRNRGINPLSVHERKKFYMAVLYLYSPRTLIGGKMYSGIRRALADITRIRSAASISDGCTGLLVLYRAYRDFREDVDGIIDGVCKSFGVARQ